ncbi:hypothetical protein L6164_018296 [Bauhinia variegata]|uniref:Uncharacterized protein n=1 Tax=Bauhinia variegata TaxID=167791 RepID=A0ACB9NCS5_BAUVA|nr:hypothetical protein L6164_018296 [Bauhinia variegata]
MASFGFLLLLSFLAFCSAASFAFASNATLPDEEVEALKEIAQTLGKYDWNFSVNPCNKEGAGNRSTLAYGEYKNIVTCDCSFASNTVCHVTHIILKGQNLQGRLPPELVNLTYLEEIDLTRNYLTGTIPLRWGLAKQWNLSKIAVLGNRLTGQVPVELTNIATLEELVLTSNQFYGNLSQGLGNFAQLKKLHLSSNNFTGELPETLAKLTTLTDFRISDNQFSGRIPNFIKSWTNLTRLEIQGSGLSGPIPPEISLLKNLEDLRISDLNGSNSTFPRLDNMKSLKKLILRSCTIIGTLPPYLREITTLETLDVSFNKLTGGIPQTFSDLNATFVFLTGNLLSGTVPEWTNKDIKVDLSYNNFSIGNTRQDTCQDGNVPLLFPHKLRWKSVKLHFAEIMFSVEDDKTYESLGKRIFDVYIQGERVLKDFNIAKEAGGVGKPIIKNFTALVTDNTLEIRLQWAGKGTTVIPVRSVYGPLISAISVESEDKPPEKGSSISAGALVGIVAAGVIIIILVFALLHHLKRKISLAREVNTLNLQTSLFSLRQIKTATGNFDISNKIGEGGFGPVYRGILSDGTRIAVKQLSSKSKQGNQIVSGSSNTIHGPKDQCFYLLDWAHLLKEKGNLTELVDPRLGSDFNAEEVMVMIKVALLCTNVTATLRPTMSSVVSMLEGSIVVPELVAESSEALDEKKLEAMRLYYQQIEEYKESEIQKQSASTEGPWTASSSSAADLYPIRLDSSYWEKRN